MAYAPITSLMETLPLSLGCQSHLRGDDKELMEVLYRKLDSLRALLEETYKIMRDRRNLRPLESQTEEIAYTAEDQGRPFALVGLGRRPRARVDPGQNSGGSVVGGLEQCDENLNEEHNINTDTNHTSENDINEEINHMSELTKFKMISTRKLSMKFYSQMVTGGYRPQLSYQGSAGTTRYTSGECTCEAEGNAREHIEGIVLD
ncbi:hypothetical protein K7X08_025305 [Anisodus acutangulus]|uniref:Uncharacterized protein n=1 Tax=Anisodus acutangulus TaxID=402998 RepID=A0A9Q1LSD8_9SOLA|nr:hypothetical protein K7X08_025305 [Anisodus acutangulus]